MILGPKVVEWTCSLWKTRFSQVFVGDSELVRIHPKHDSRIYVMDWTHSLQKNQKSFWPHELKHQLHIDTLFSQLFLGVRIVGFRSCCSEPSSPTSRFPPNRIILPLGRSRTLVPIKWYHISGLPWGIFDFPFRLVSLPRIHIKIQQKNSAVLYPLEFCNFHFQFCFSEFVSIVVVSCCWLELCSWS